MDQPSVYNVTDWWAKYDDLLKKITDLVSFNDPAWEIKSNCFPGDYEDIYKSCVELGFRDIVQFCESFPNKFLVNRDTGTIKINQDDQMEQIRTSQPNRCASTTQKTNMDDETRALLANYNPVPPSQRREKMAEESATTTSSSMISEKKSECIHFKLSYDEKTRRFAFPRESDIFGCVKQRVQKIVERRDPVIYWRDEDSLIVLECGDDMEAAIDFAEHQKTPACVMLEASVEEEKEEEEKDVKEEEDKEEDKVIVSREESAAAFNGFAFVCDECDCFLGPSNGGRYKCMVCADYDLCAACVAKGIHSIHALVRLLDADTIIPLAHPESQNGVANVHLMQIPRCTPSFAARLADDSAHKSHEMEALKSVTEMLKAVVDGRLDEIEREEEKLALEKEKLEKMRITKREEAMRGGCRVEIYEMGDGQEEDEEDQEEEEMNKMEEEAQRLEEERLRNEEEERAMIEERRQIIEEIAMYEVMQKERDRLEEEKRWFEEEVKNMEEIKKEEEEERLRNEEEERAMIEERRQRQYNIEETAKYELIWKEAEDKKNEERKKMEEEEKKIEERKKMEEEEQCRIERELSRLREADKKKEERRRMEILEEIAHYEEKMRKKEIRFKEEAKKREQEERRKMENERRQAEEVMRMVTKEFTRKEEEEEERARMREEMARIEEEEREDMRLTYMQRMQKKEWERRKIMEHEEMKRMDKEREALLKMEREERVNREKKDETIDEMMKNIQGDLEKIGEAVGEMTQIEVALSKELGEQKEEDNDLWVAYETWKEEVKLEQKERKDSSSLGSDIEIIDKLVEESDSVLETMHVLESKFDQLQLLPIREPAMPILDTVLTVPTTVLTLPTVPALPTVLDVPTERTVRAQPTVPLVASSTTVYTTAPSTPTVDDLVFSFDSAESIKPTPTPVEFVEATAPEERTVNYPRSELSLEDLMKSGWTVEHPIRQDIEPGSEEVDCIIPVFMEHAVMLELYEMQNAREIPTRLNQYYSNVAMHLNCDELREHKPILNINKEVDDELIKSVAFELQCSLKELKSRLGGYLYSKDRLFSRVCELRARIRRFSFDEDLRYRKICKELHRFLLTDESTVQPIKSSEAPSSPIPSSTSAFTPYYDALSMPIDQPIPRPERYKGEELNEQQQKLLSKLFETGIFDDKDYERMVEVCLHANNLEQAIDMMLE